MKQFIVCLALAVSMSAGCYAADQAPSANKAILRNLANASARAMAAQEKYTAFAVKADEEGYKKVGQLFRAAAESKNVQLVTIDKAITELGGKPSMKMNKVVAKSTKENLEWALKDASDEADTMYPKYMADAKPSGVKSAMVAFYRGTHVQTNIKAFFKDALGNLDSWKTAAEKGFYVCQVCGNVTADINFEDCPVCGVPASNCKQII